MKEIDAARKQLKEIAEDLEAVKFRLLGVLSVIPVSASEADSLQDVDSRDPGAELRGRIQSLLSDQVEPLCLGLRNASAPQSSQDGE